MKHARLTKTLLLTLCALILCGAAALAADDEALPQLDAPTELQWGVDYYNSYSGDEDSQEPTERPGMISWKDGALTQNKIQVAIYRVEEGEDVECCRMVHSFGADSTEIYHSVESFYADDYMMIDDDAIDWSQPDAQVQSTMQQNGFPSGTYYFTLQSLGDGFNYRDSEIVTSDTWDYVRPTAQLPQVQLTGWDWPSARWDSLAEEPYFDSYQIEWYHVAEGSEEIIKCGGSYGFEMNEDELYDGAIQGPGQYYYQVRAISSDITQCLNGPWSALSEAYDLTEVTGIINNKLREIAEWGLSDDELREEISYLDRGLLRSSMLAEDETIAAMEELEGTIKGASKSVSVDDVAMDSSEIEFTGALLNPVTSSEVNLAITPPEREDVIPARYNDTVALRFHMTVEGIADPEDLAVPVAVSMPVPENINPEFLAILHYPLSGGAPEVITPGVDAQLYEQFGRTYVRFVLDRFSDFVLTERDSSAGSSAEDYARRAYETILGRAADEEGLAHWTSEMASGVSGGAIIDEFFRSEEYDAQNHTEGETVRLCYLAMLGREPEESEIMNWTAMLADGYSTSRLVAEFVASPEFATICETYGLTAGAIELGPRDSNSNLTRFVQRCYDFALERPADEGGLNEWCGHVLSGDVNEAGELITPERVVFGFVFSGEAQAKERDDTAFITMLYHIMLDRDPDEAGLEAWSTALADWEKNLGQDAGRQKLYAEFAAMPEFGLMLNNFTL